MLVVGFGLSWLAYTIGFWGHSLVKGYNLSFSQIASPSSYYKGTWPPKLAGNTVIIPNGTTASEQSVTLASYTGAPITTTVTTSGGGSSGSSAPAKAAGSAPKGVSNAAAIQKAAALFGWGKGTQWDCLTNVISAESGGNPNAYNASGAYGIAQALGHGTSATTGCGHAAYGGYGLTAAQAKEANCGNAYYQAFWMMGYIKAVYGNPCGAWKHEQDYHWY
jgi:Transglycosylase SLT domain